MPRGEATSDGIEALMAVTSSLEVYKDTITGEGFIIPYSDVGEKPVYGVVLIGRDTHGNETGRMIAIIQAVTTKQEEDEAGRRFAEMNP